MPYDFNEKIKEKLKEVIIGNDNSEVLEFFNNNKVPTIRNEEWKYTNLSFLNKIEFLPEISHSVTDLSESDIKAYTLNKLSENLIVFVNGIFNGLLSNIDKLNNAGIQISIVSDSNSVNKKDIKISKDSSYFDVMNNVFSIDRCNINVNDNIDLEEPIHILNIIDTRNGLPFVNIRNTVTAGANSRIKILETNHLIGANPGLICSFTNIVCNNDSIVDYSRIQDESGDLYQICDTNVNQGKGSTFNSHTVTLNSKFTRNNLTSNLNGEHCECNFNGIYYLTNDHYVDNHTLVNHISPNCNSNETYRGILGDKSTGVFNGKIKVWKDAQKTNAYQSNKNILLSDTATINTKPQLEIFADDVKCSHGATSGSIDEGQLFYLKSRGIPEPSAKSMLLLAFTSELIDGIIIPELREKIKEKVTAKLGISDLITF